MTIKGYKTLLPYFRKHVLRLGGGLTALLLVDFLQLMIPRVIKAAVDQLSLGRATTGSLAVLGLYIVGMAVVIGIFRYVWRWCINGFSRVVEEDMRRRLYDKLLTMAPAWFMKRTTGDIMALATNDLEAVRMSSGIGLVALTDAVVLSAASIGFMLWINPRLTLYALIPMTLIPLLSRYMGAMMYKRFRRVQEIFGRLSGEVREYLSGIRVVKAHNQEAMVLEDTDRLGREYVSMNVRANMISGAFFPLMLMFSNLSTALLIYFGGRMAVLGQVSPGEFVAFISYLGLLTWPMMALGWVINLVQRGAAGLDRINAVLDKQPDIRDPEDPVSIGKIKGGIEIRNLTFTYPDRERPVLENLNFSCPAGLTAAIVGRTGSGKSTMLNLIPRLFDPPAETVFLDDTAVDRVCLTDLRGAIGYVPQDGYIFSGTIHENLALSCPEATLDDLRETAAMAELDREIDGFQDGFETRIGERGVTLSGGQKQRLALARALLANPPLLILDDTLSAVDADAEARILANLARARKGKTTIISSHRLTSLKIADIIHVIESGRITQSGDYEALIGQDGYFAHLYNLQVLADAGRLEQHPDREGE